MRGEVPFAPRKYCEMPGERPRRILQQRIQNGRSLVCFSPDTDEVTPLP